jgi:hypothetical protein
MATLALATETWGERLARAWKRRGVSGRTIAKAVDGTYRTVTYATVGRLAGLEEPPTAIGQVVLAGVILAALGYNPADFGLPTDAHLIYRQPAVVAAVADRLPPTSTPCYRINAGEALAA